jgi:hypothetical protein
MGAMVSIFWYSYKVYKQHLGEVVITNPIVGSNVEELVYKNI